MDHETPPPVPEQRTLLDMLEACSDAALRSHDTGWVLMYLDLLRDKDKSVFTRWQVAINELQATERLQRLAEKHEDVVLGGGLAEDAAYLRDEALPWYQALWPRYDAQWRRLWGVLEERAGERDPA